MTTITPPPAAPDRGHGQTAYNAEVAAYLAWQAINASEMAGFAATIDPLAALTPSIIAALNFKGAWSSLSGALNIPASVYHSGLQWMLLQNLANVASVTPGTNTAYWVPLTGWTVLGTHNAATTPTAAISFTSILAGYSAVALAFDGLANNAAAARDYYVKTSINNGSAWSANPQTAASLSSGQAAYGMTIFEGYDRSVGAMYSAAGYVATSGLSGGGNVQGAGQRSGPVNALQLTMSSTGNFNAGTVTLLGRR